MLCNNVMRIRVDCIPGRTGSWELSTPQRKDIFGSIWWGIEQIRAATGESVVDQKQQLVIDEWIAAKVATSMEITHYLETIRHRAHEIHDCGFPRKFAGCDVRVNESDKVLLVFPCETYAVAAVEFMGAVS